MELIQDRAMKFRVRNPDRITNVIPKSKYLGEPEPGVHEVVVHFGVEEAQVLKNLNLRGVRSPIAFKYKWPGGRIPFEHQKTTSEFLTLHKRCYVLNEQGTGKTSSVLWAADYLMNVGLVKRMLVICPVSIMRSAWVGDAFQTVIHRRVAVAHGTKQQRLDAINSEAEIVVINYDGVDIVKDEIKGKFDVIAADEATYLKTSTTKRWKAVKHIIGPETWLWLMTGTPAAQSPLDAYGLAKLCTPSRVPSYFTAWRDKVMTKLNMFKWVPIPKATELVNEALQPAIRFTKDECLDLPEMLYQTRDVEMSVQQKKYYRALKSKMLCSAAGEQISAVHAAAMLNKLLQLSLGAVYADSGDVIKFDADNRLAEMLEVVQDSPHKTIVFVPFKHAITIVKEYLQKAGVSVECIYGDVPLGKRTKIFKDFQESDDPKVLVVQPQSAAHGVTLTAANTIIWFGPTFSLETYLQGNARIHRPGQVNKCLVVRLCGSDVEKKVYEALDRKEDDQVALMKLYEDIAKGD